jgi:hypothetical protein
MLLSILVWMLHHLLLMESPNFKLSQPHLIQSVIDAIEQSDDRSVIGMLKYPCGTQPDILYSVHQCSRFCNQS